MSLNCSECGKFIAHDWDATKIIHGLGRDYVLVPEMYKDPEDGEFKFKNKIVCMSCAKQREERSKIND